MYGGFWMSFGTIFIPGSGILTAYGDATSELDSALGIYLFTWFIITFLLLCVYSAVSRSRACADYPAFSYHPLQGRLAPQEPRARRAVLLPDDNVRPARRRYVRVSFLLRTYIGRGTRWDVLLTLARALVPQESSPWRTPTR